MDFQPTAFVVALAWVAVLALLLFEHAHWAHLDFRWRYIMGMGTVCAGCLAAGVILGNAPLAIVPGVLSTAGLVIVAVYADEDKTEREKRIAQQQGEIIGMAKGIRRDLTQEMIDRGDNESRN